MMTMEYDVNIIQIKQSIRIQLEVRVTKLSTDISDFS